jgi:hypothetical protein
LAFTVFLAEGHRYRPQAAQHPASVSDAIASATMETFAFYVRHDRTEELVGLLPLVAYLILAPFTGADAARKFVQGKLREIPANQTSVPVRTR